MTKYLESLEEAKNVLEEAKTNIAEDELDPAFDLVRNLTKRSYELFDIEIISLRQRYSKLKSETRKNIISVSERNVIHAQVCNSFLETINEIEKKITEEIKKEKAKNDSMAKKRALQDLEHDNKPSAQPIYSSTVGSDHSPELENNIISYPSIDQLQVRDNFSTSKLEKHLSELDFRNADIETSKLFLTIVDDTNKIFDQKLILHFPISLFQIIDSLWAKYSDNKFGFSAQRNIWDTLPKKDSDYTKVEKFATLVGWKINDKWVKGSNSLNYTLIAPVGHLPTLTFVQYENTEKWRSMWMNNFNSLTKKFASC